MRMISVFIRFYWECYSSSILFYLYSTSILPLFYSIGIIMLWYAMVWYGTVTVPVPVPVPVLLVKLQTYICMYI